MSFGPHEAEPISSCIVVTPKCKIIFEKERQLARRSPGLEYGFSHYISLRLMLHMVILDEWLLYPLKETEAKDLPEIAEARYKKASTIFCSQIDIPG